MASHVTEWSEHKGSEISINGRVCTRWSLSGVRPSVVSTVFLPSSNQFCFISKTHGMKEKHCAQQRKVHRNFNTT